MMEDEDGRSGGDNLISLGRSDIPQIIVTT